MSGLVENSRRHVLSCRASLLHQFESDGYQATIIVTGGSRARGSMCAQRRLIPEYASAQSDQSLRFVNLTDKLIFYCTCEYDATSNWSVGNSTS